MTDEEKNRLKDKIIDEIAVQEKNIEALEEVTKPIPPDDAIGRLTRMEAINAKSINEASLRSARVKLTKLKRAISKLDDPDFGICTVCEEPIPIGRIMLMPETTLCVSCADR
jgi:DnaK suppressor protein